MTDNPLSVRMPGAAPHSAERARLVLKIAKQDRDLPPDASKEVLDGIMGAIGQLPYLVESGELPEANHREAARLILSYAAQRVRAVPEDLDDEQNPKVAAYAIKLFQSPKVALALSQEERGQLVDLLWQYAGREIWAMPGRTEAEINQWAVANALDTLATPHLFACLGEDGQRRLSALFLRYSAVGHVDVSKEDRFELWFLFQVSKGHLFSRLSNEERQAVAQALLAIASQDIADLSRGLGSYSRINRIGRALFRLSREHVFRALGARGRTEAALLFLQYAFQQPRVTVGDPGQIRIRIDPVVFSLEGLARKVVFEALPKDAADRAALLVYSYAKGEMQLDPERPGAADTQILGIKVGVQGLSREHMFKSLPAELQMETAILLLRYARREKAVGMPHFPLEDLTGGIVERAHKALKRKFILEALPTELRTQAESLHVRQKTNT